MMLRSSVCNAISCTVSAKVMIPISSAMYFMMVLVINDLVDDSNVNRKSHLMTACSINT